MQLAIYTVTNLGTGKVVREEAASHCEALYIVSEHNKNSAWEGPAEHADWSVTLGDDVKYYIISDEA